MGNIQINNDSEGKSYAIKVSHNQKVIQIKRANPLKQTVNFDANRQALKTLTANGYVLYMYLTMHPHDMVWALSRKDVFNETTLKERAYEAAVADLIQNKYLVPHDINSTYGNWKADNNAYYFYENNGT